MIEESFYQLLSVPDIVKVPGSIGVLDTCDVEHDFSYRDRVEETIPDPEEREDDE